MVFSSVPFLYAFLPAVLLLYFCSPRGLRNPLLLLASLLFYAWGGGIFVLLLLTSCACNYVLGLLVERTRDRPRQRALCVASSVGVNLAILGSFKYANFAVEQWDALAGGVGLPPLEWTALALPIGISFYTFQSMSYVFDVARGAARPFRNPVDFALYVSMFPQLVAGPIVRFHQIADQIRERHSRLTDVSEGAVRFLFGLVKKVVVADSVGAIADAAFASPASGLSPGVAWLGLLAYTLQIYFDFSGYSDMAIGLGRMFGFRLPENFDRPYSALSITDFWRRWHMTLSAWFRDYLYLPLGGSRRGTLRTYRNLVAVFLLVGLWHGANWTFLVWGAYHGALLILERLTGRRALEGAPRPALQRALTLLLVALGWVVFRATDLSHAGGYYAALVGLGGDLGGLVPSFGEALTTRSLIVLGLATLVFVLPRDLCVGPLLERAPGRWLDVARAVLLLVAAPYAAVLILSRTYQPFLYFQF